MGRVNSAVCSLLACSVVMLLALVLLVPFLAFVGGRRALGVGALACMHLSVVFFGMLCVLFDMVSGVGFVLMFFMRGLGSRGESNQSYKKNEYIFHRRCPIFHGLSGDYAGFYCLPSSYAFHVRGFNESAQCVPNDLF